MCVLLAVLPMLFVTSTRTPAGFFSGDAGPKLLQTQAFAAGGPWPRAITYPARPLDPGLKNLPVSMTSVHGRVVSFFPFLYSLIAAPGYPLFGVRAFLIVSVLSALLAAWLAGWLAARLSGGRVPVAMGMALVLGTTPLMFYGSCMWAHALMAAAVLGAMALVLAALDRGTRRETIWLLAGLVAGIAGWIRTEGFLFLALAAVPLVWRRNREGVRDSAAAGVGGILGVVAGAVLQRLTLGAWLPVHIVAVMTGRHVYEVPFIMCRLKTVRRLFVPDLWCGLALAVWLIALVLAVRRPTARSTRLAGMGSIAAGLVAAVVAPGVRLLGGTSPASAFPVRSATAVWVVLAALPLLLAHGHRHTRDEHRAAITVGAVAGGFAVVFLVASPVDGGYQWGARLYLPVVLLLTVLLASRLPGLRDATRLDRAAVAVTIVSAVAIQLFGMALLVHVTRGNAAFEAALAAHTTPGEVVVTDTFYLPELGAPIWSRRRFLLVTSAHGLPDLLARLRAGNVRTWVFASANDANLGLSTRLSLRAAADGWRPVKAQVVHLPGRELRLIRYAVALSGSGLRKAASSSRLPF